MIHTINFLILSALSVAVPLLLIIIIYLLFDKDFSVTNKILAILICLFCCGLVGAFFYKIGILEELDKVLTVWKVVLASLPMLALAYIAYMLVGYTNRRVKNKFFRATSYITRIVIWGCFIVSYICNVIKFGVIS